MARRVLIVVTHLLGSGHLSRAVAIATGLGAAGFEATLASGGMPVPLHGHGPYRFVQLPPVRIAGTDYARLLDETGSAVDDAYRARRIAALSALVRETPPDAVIVEHFPFGRRLLAPEFLAAIDAAKAVAPDVFVLASVRDVIIAPAAAARRAEIARLVASRFDGVLVHGDRAFLPLESAWPAPPAEMAAKLIYTGYVARTDFETQPGMAALPAFARPEILVSGGGSAVALPLFRMALAAARLDMPNRDWRILVGHGVSDARFRGLLAQAEAGGEGGRVTVERARPDFAALLARCAASVSQAGYNTVSDLLQARRPAVVVPYTDDSDTDQILRAEAMAGAAQCVVREGGALTPAMLLAAVEEAISRGPPPKAAVDLDGVAATVGIIESRLAAAIGKISSRRQLRG